MKVKRFDPAQVAILCVLLVLVLACGQSAPLASAPPPTSPASSTLPATSPSPAVQLPNSPMPTIPPADSPAPTVPAADTTRSLSFEGMQRSYLLHLPPGFDPAQPFPVVLVFHGFTLDGQEMVRITGFNAQADASNFIVVYPEGTGRRRGWNGGDCCGEAAVKKVDDVGFVRAILDELSQIATLDRKRIYATGFSNGAIMVYRLACDLADQIAAIAPIGATQATQSCQPARPVPVIHFHGDADTSNPYEGGTSEAGVVFLPVDETIDWWAKHNGCPAQAIETQTGKIVHRVYAPCTQSADVELYKILDGEHAWPGGEPVTAEIGLPTTEISATPLMWAFFAAHPMP